MRFIFSQKLKEVYPPPPIHLSLELYMSTVITTLQRGACSYIA